MAVNTSATFAQDAVAYMDDELLPLAQRKLVAYRHGDPIKMPEGRGTVYQAIRRNRLPLPYAPLAEGVPPVGQIMSNQLITGKVQQWGAIVVETDVAEVVTYHPTMQGIVEMLALQIGETYERNTFNTLMSGTQVQYANNEVSRFALAPGDVLTPLELVKASGILRFQGAPMYNGSEQTNYEEDLGTEGDNADEDPRLNDHYLAIIAPPVTSDLKTNTDMNTAWSRSDINVIYNHAVGYWSGIVFTESNMMPSFTGFALVDGTAGTAGTLATNTYYIIVTGSDDQNQYESQIYQVNAGDAVTGPNGSLSVTLRRPRVSRIAFISARRHPLSILVFLRTAPFRVRCKVRLRNWPLALLRLLPGLAWRKFLRLLWLRGTRFILLSSSGAELTAVWN